MVNFGEHSNEEQMEWFSMALSNILDNYFFYHYSLSSASPTHMPSANTHLHTPPVKESPRTVGVFIFLVH